MTELGLIKFRRRPWFTNSYGLKIPNFSLCACLFTVFCNNNMTGEPAYVWHRSKNGTRLSVLAKCVPNYKLHEASFSAMLACCTASSIRSTSAINPVPMENFHLQA